MDRATVYGCYSREFEPHDGHVKSNRLIKALHSRFSCLSAGLMKEMHCSLPVLLKTVKRSEHQNILRALSNHMRLSEVKSNTFYRNWIEKSFGIENDFSIQLQRHQRKLLSQKIIMAFDKITLQ